MGQEGRGAEDPSGDIKYINRIKAISQNKTVQKSKGEQNKNIDTPEQHTMTTMQILWLDTPAKTMPSVWQNVQAVQ